MGYGKITCCLLLLATYIVAQETEDKKGTFNKKLPVRLGSDGRPLLFAPKIEMCVNRKYSSHIVTYFSFSNKNSISMCLVSHIRFNQYL